MVTDLANRDADGVVITDTVPANTTFVLASSSVGWSCVDGSPAGAECTYSVGSLAAGGGSATVQFALQVVDPLSTGVSQIANSALAEDDGSHGTDPDTDNNSDSDINQLARLGDFVWYDINNNGLQDVDEPGIPNVTLELVLGGSVVDTFETDASGVYTFYVDVDTPYDIRIQADEFETGGTLENLDRRRAERKRTQR